MAKFGENMPGLKLLDSFPPSKDGSLSAQKFGFSGKAKDDDFMSQLDKMTKAMRDQQEEQRAEIKLDALNLDKGLVDEDAVESPVTKLLRQAKQLIVEEKYQEAMAPLREILKRQASHHEAIYLLAYCHCESNDNESALRSLLPMRGARLEKALGERVAALKAKIRARMFLTMALENFLLLQMGHYDRAVNQARRVVELDPEHGLYYFILAGSLMQAGRLEDGVAAINDGLKNCAPGERQTLETLKRQIEREYVTEKMIPSRGYFKKGRYGKARSSLDLVAPQFRNHPLYLTFATYLAQLDSGVFRFLRRKNARDIVPEGRREDVEDLYFFLAEEELAQARRLITQEQYEQAEVALLGALSYTHNFPFVHYLYGGCVYSRVMRQITSGNPQDLEAVIADLEAASGHARIGAADTDISDAKALQGVINDTHKYLLSIRKEHEAVQTYFNQFTQKMDALNSGGGISSYPQLNDARNYFRSLKTNAEAAKRSLKTQQAKNAMDQVIAAVDRVLRQLG